MSNRLTTHTLGRRARRRGPAAETCEVEVECLSTAAGWQDRVWWRFVVRPTRLTRTGLLQSPTFLAASDPALPTGRHPRRDDPATRVALDSIMADCVRAGWEPLRRGPCWFSVRFSRPRRMPLPHPTPLTPCELSSPQPPLLPC